MPNSTLSVKSTYLAIGGLLFVSGSLLLAGSRSIVFHPSATFDWLNMFLAAAVGLLTWMVLEQRSGHADHSAPLFGAVSGIVTIAGGCSSVSPAFAILIAVVGATGSYVLLQNLKPGRNHAEWRMLSVHGVSALIGILLTGVFASADIAGADSSGRPIIGLLGGNSELWRIQGLTGSVAAVLAAAAGFFLPTICNGIGLLLAPGETPKKTALGEF